MEILKYYHRYIKSHLYYLISKKNLIVLIILNLIFFSYSFYISNIFKSWIELDSYREYYFSNFNSNFFLSSKIIYISIILFLNISYFGKEYKEYSAYFIRNKRTKIDFYITKYIAFILVMVFEEFIFFLIYIFYCAILPYGMIKEIYVITFFNIFYLGLFYFLLSSIFIIIFKTYLSSLFSLIFFFMSLALGEYSTTKNTFYNIVLLILPYPSGETSIYFYGSAHIVLYLLILSILNFFAIAIFDNV